MKLIFFLTASLFIFGCSKKDTTDGADFTETAQQIGDVMASIDEMGGQSNGAIALFDKSAEKMFARLAPDNSGELTKTNLVKLIQPEAQALTCSGNGFAACATNSITRTFNGCTVGTATFTGSVVLSWSNTSACAMTVANVDTITRAPAFSVTGRRSATLAVTKTGTYGQKLMWVSGTAPNRVMAFTSDGINRKFTSSTGTVLFNQTTSTSGTMYVTGDARSGRVLNGILTVANTLTGVSCNYNASNVTWNAACNCPVSGTWSGTCSTGKSSTLVLNSCGTGTFTDGTDTSSVTFDRCGT